MENVQKAFTPYKQRIHVVEFPHYVVHVGNWHLFSCTTTTTSLLLFALCKEVPTFYMLGSPNHKLL